MDTVFILTRDIMHEGSTIISAHATEAGAQAAASRYMVLDTDERWSQLGEREWKSDFFYLSIAETPLGE